jgi:serine/threonine protein kinase
MPPAPDWLRELGWEEVYEVRRLIARGGMGRVYEGWHRTLGIPVALKIIDPHLVSEDHIRARFEKEAMTLARLQEPVPHPNIVRVIDFKLLDSVGCIVMAYIKGMDLRAWCVDLDLGDNVRVGLIEQVARAAGYFHSFGLVHRDLKPANVLVREGCGEPVIVDFGIVRGREDVTLTRTQQALGTAAYMAPEILGVKSVEKATRSTTADCDAEPRNPDEISPTADVYALGVMLYELLCGELPYGTTLAEVLPKHQKESPPSIFISGAPRFSRDLERVCLKAIAHRPSERYANGTALAEDLARYLRGEPVLARPISKIRHAARRAKQRPLLCMAAGAGIVLALFTIGRLVMDARQMKVAHIREQIGVNMPVTTWSSAHLKETDRLIDELNKYDSTQAAVYHQTLIHGAAREILQVLKQPRIGEAERIEIEATIAWIKDHDAAEAARLSLVVEERQSRWNTLLEIRPPFQNVGKFFKADQSRVEGDHLIMEGMSTQERLLQFTRPPPLEVSATFKIPEHGTQVLGFKVLLFDEWHTVQYYQPPPSSLISHLAQFQSIMEAPKAALAISRKDRVLAATLVQSPLVPGKEVRMKLHLENRKVSLEVSDGSRVEYLQRYQPVLPVSVALVGEPQLQMHDLHWSGPADLPKTSVLEKGDNYAGSERWWPAETYFLKMIGDPEYGAEALFKAGDCQRRQGRLGDAQATWEKLMSGPESPWRTEACLQLWYHHANAGRLNKARIYLDQLPGPEDMPADYLAQLNEPGRKLDNFYRSVGRGINLLRPTPDVEDAVRVHRMLRYTPHELAARFALSRHFNGTDEAARDLLLHGLALKKIDQVTLEEVRTLNTNLELWSLIARAETDLGLAKYQADWLSRAPRDHSIALTIRLDQARQLARAGQKAGAIKIAQDVLQAEQSTIMAFTGAALLLSALDADPDHTAVKQALQRINQVPRQVHELTLTHRLLLHSIAKNWNSQSAVEILSQLLSVGESGENRESLRGRISRFLLQDKGIILALNQLLSGSKGQNMLNAFALRHQPVRQPMHELFYMLLRRHVIFSAFDSQPTELQTNAAAAVTRLWLDSFSERTITVHDFFLLMENLRGNEPTQPLKTALPGWPQPLQKAVLQLFQSRNS